MSYNVTYKLECLEITGYFVGDVTIGGHDFRNGYASEYSWDDYREHMIEYSRKVAHTTFKLIIHGEELGDACVLFFRNGEVREFEFETGWNLLEKFTWAEEHVCARCGGVVTIENYPNNRFCALCVELFRTEIMA